MEDNEKQFTKGFNNGYTIAQHQPDLFEKLEKGLRSSNDYTQGFLSGGKEYGRGKSIVRVEHKRSEERLPGEISDKDFEKEK